MKTYQELIIKGESEQIEAFVRELILKVKSSPDSGWWFDPSDFGSTKKRSFDHNIKHLYYFRCNEEGERLSAKLILIKRHPPGLFVINIFPSDASKHGLTYDEYNIILHDFYDSFINPIAEAPGISATLTTNELSIENFIGGNALHNLKAFDSKANKSTGSSHPSDKLIWHCFIVGAHLSKSDLTSSILKRWLHEEQNWDSDTAFELCVEYEQGRNLLEFYDEHKAGMEDDL